jgi:D-galactarolactone cycloisomerase
MPADELAGASLAHRNGWVNVPAGLGLGIEIDRAVLDRYRVA